MKSKLFRTIFLSCWLLSGTSPNCIQAQDPPITIAFGACNKTAYSQEYWNVIGSFQATTWIWLGDIIYADTDDSTIMRSMYQAQKNNVHYQAFSEHLQMEGTWDDHDYGLNDGGKDWAFKTTSKRLFAEFMGFDSSHSIWSHDGVYYDTDLSNSGLHIKLLSLDTRSFRDSLTLSPDPTLRYTSNPNGDVLGEAQWEWLEKSLSDSTVDVFVISSSIQVIADDHGYEKWANLPAAKERLYQLLQKTQPTAVLFISGDRHIAEFSVEDSLLAYPVFDVTSSGLTHTWSKIEEEPNAHRKGPMIIATNFGLLHFYNKPEEIVISAQIHAADNGLLLGRELIRFPK